MANEEKMESAAGALEEFRRLGFTGGMAVADGRLTVEGSDRRYRPDQVEIADYRRFEGVSDPSDSSVVYAIETHDGVKGTLVDSYNAYADAGLGEFLRDVRVSPRAATAPHPTVPAFERPSALNQKKSQA